MRSVLLLALVSTAFALQLGEVSVSNTDAFVETGNDVLDQLQQLVSQSQTSPVSDFPKMLETARALAAQLDDSSKQTLLQVFLTMKVRVTETVTTTQKEVDDVTVIITARIADKEVQITKIRDEMLTIQRTYEEQQATRLKEIETIKRVKALLIQIMNNFVTVNVTKTTTTTTDSGRSVSFAGSSSSSSSTTTTTVVSDPTTAPTAGSNVAPPPAPATSGPVVPVASAAPTAASPAASAAGSSSTSSSSSTTTTSSTSTSTQSSSATITSSSSSSSSSSTISSSSSSTTTSGGSATPSSSSS